MLAASPGCDYMPRQPEPPVTRDGLTPGGGPREIKALYVRGTLQAQLPETLRPQEMLAAARIALEQRGYTITGDSATRGLGRLFAEAPPGSRDWHWPRYVRVTASMTQDGNRVDIAMRPPDQVLSSALLDDALRRLGR